MHCSVEIWLRNINANESNREQAESNGSESSCLGHRNNEQIRYSGQQGRIGSKWQWIIGEEKGEGSGYQQTKQEEKEGKF